jgi:hypothetical protein
LSELAHDLGLGGGFGKVFFLINVMERHFMCVGYFYSLVFALMTSASIPTIAAPVAKPDTVAAPLIVQVAPSRESSKVDLNEADATILRREFA